MSGESSVLILFFCLMFHEWNSKEQASRTRDEKAHGLECQSDYCRWQSFRIGYLLCSAIVENRLRLHMLPRESITFVKGTRAVA